MEKLGFGLDDDSATCDQKQINPQESRLLTIQRKIKYLDHACRCRDANCRLPSCQRVKWRIQHTKSCKVMMKGGCLPCKYLLATSYQHAILCQEAKCPIVYCSLLREKLEYWKPELQARSLKRHIATMKNRRMSVDVLQTSSGNSNSSNGPSLGAQPHSSLHPPQPDIGMKPSTEPPVDSLQAVQPVQAAATGKTDPHILAASVNYGKGNPDVILPSTRLMAAIQQMDVQMQMLNMGNVACWEGSGYAQNPQSRQNPQAQPNPHLSLRHPIQLMGGSNNLSNSIGNSAMRPPQVMPNSDPLLQDQHRLGSSSAVTSDSKISSISTATAKFLPF